MAEAGHEDEHGTCTKAQEQGKSDHPKGFDQKLQAATPLFIGYPEPKGPVIVEKPIAVQGLFAMAIHAKGLCNLGPLQETR